MPAKTRTLIVLGLCALLISACGGSGAAVKEPSGRFAVTIDDYLIRPETVPRMVTSRARIRASTRAPAAIVNA